MDNRLFYKGCFGLERETLRVDREGRLAQTPHPFGDDEHMTRDFCENQIELITPVCHSIDEVMDELEKLDHAARKKLAEMNESIWLYSNPPHFENEDDIPVANFTGEHSGKRLYREQLERRYGKRLMLFSGIHFNFSFDDEYLRSISGGEDFGRFRDAFYLRLYKQISAHSWLLVLLTASSPICDASLYEDGASGAFRTRYASIRSGERGYWNSFRPKLRFGSLDDFIASIREHVDKGMLFSASELYLPVRLKPCGVNDLSSFKNGVSHIELRMFDLAPTEPLGVNEDDLRFAHLLMMYLSAQPDLDFTEERQEQAVIDHQNASLYSLEGVTIGGTPILEKASQVIGEMEKFFEGDEAALAVLGYEKTKLNDRLCERIDPGDIYG